MEMTKEETKAPVRVVVRGAVKPRGVKSDGVGPLCRALAAAIRADPEKGNYRRYSDLAQDIGYAPSSSGAVSDIAALAIDAGYIKPKPFKSHGLFFTELGLRRFMPEALPQADPAPEPEFAKVDTIPIETPIVAQVAAPVERRAEPRTNANPLDFDLNSDRLRVTGATTSKAELATFIGKLGALMPFLKD